MRMEESRLLNKLNDSNITQTLAEANTIDDNIFVSEEVRDALNDPLVKNLPLYHTNAAVYVDDQIKSAVELVEKSNPEDVIFSHKNVRKNSSVGVIDQFKVLSNSKPYESFNSNIVFWDDKEKEEQSAKSEFEQQANKLNPNKTEVIRTDSYKAAERIQKQNIEYINKLLNYERELQDKALESVRIQLVDHVKSTGAHCVMPKREELFANSCLNKKMLCEQINKQTENLKKQIDRGLVGSDMNQKDSL